MSHERPCVALHIRGSWVKRKGKETDGGGESPEKKCREGSRVHAGKGSGGGEAMTLSQ